MLSAQAQIDSDLDRISKTLRCFAFAELVGLSDDEVRQAHEAVERMTALTDVPASAPQEFKELSESVLAGIAPPMLRALRRMLSAAVRTRETLAN